MATRIAKYAFLDARVSMMAGRLLPQPQMESLVDVPAGEQKALLERVGLHGIDPEGKLDADRLDRAVSALILDEFTQLIRPTSGAARDLLLYLAYRFELSNLKTIIRGRLNEQSAATIKQELVPLGEWETLNIDALLAAEDVAELLRQLEGNPRFANIARQAREVYEDRHDSFTLEASIDRQYYAGLSDRVERFKGPGAALVGELAGDLIDRINLIWLLRFRFAYELPPAEAYFLLVPSGRRLRPVRLLALAELESWEQMREQLPAPMRESLADAQSISEIDRVLRQAALQRARAVLDGTRFNLARPFAYLLLREECLRRVAAIVKGRAI